MDCRIRSAEATEQLRMDLPEGQLVDFIGANATSHTKPHRALPQICVWVHKSNVFNWFWKYGGVRK